MVPAHRATHGGRLPDVLSSTSLLIAITPFVQATVNGPDWGWLGGGTLGLYAAVIVALLEKGARGTGRYVSGEYRFQTLHGSHWMLDEQPDAVADLLLEWLAAHPI